MLKPTIVGLRVLAACVCFIAAGALGGLTAISPSAAWAGTASKPGAPLSLDHAHPRVRRVHHRIHRRRRPVRRVERRAAVHPAPPVRAVAPAAPKDDVIRLAAEQAEGTDARAASDIATVLANDGVKVMPVLEPDALGTIEALPQSPDVDLAFVRADVLDAAKAKDPSIVKSIGYVSKLFDEEVVVLAKDGIVNLHQLDGKKVGVGVAGSSDWVTGRNVFEKLGIHPQFVEQDTQASLAALDKGDLDAAVIVGGNPAPLLFAPRTPGVHILAIPYDATLQAQYFPAELTHADYPKLIPGPQVETVAVPTLLVAPMVVSDPERRQRIEAFANAFLEHFNALMEPGRYARWKDVNLAADAPGWDRIPAAKQWLDTAEAREEKQFDAFVASRAQAMPKTANERDKLFQEFVKWNSSQVP